MTDRASATQTGQRPEEPLDRLVDDVTTVAHQQTGRAWQEVRDTIGDAGPGAVLLVGAGVCAALAVASGWTATLRLMESAVPRQAAGGLLFVAYSAGAAALAIAGGRRLRAHGAVPGRVVGGVSERMSDTLGHVVRRARRR
jgi:hypothetical protein